MYIQINIIYIYSSYIMAAPRGLSTPRALKVKQLKTLKQMVTEHWFSLPICTICCMREAVYTSYGSHILPAPDLKTAVPFLSFSISYFFSLFLGAHLAYGYTSRAGAIIYIYIYLSLLRVCSTRLRALRYVLIAESFFCRRMRTSML